MYRCALIEGCEYGTIIVFYNQVFMHNMKNYILQFAPTRQVMNLWKPLACKHSQNNIFICQLGILFGIFDGMFDDSMCKKNHIKLHFICYSSYGALVMSVSMFSICNVYMFFLYLSPVTDLVSSSQDYYITNLQVHYIYLE